MKVLIGDIGNTFTKICLIDINTFKATRIIYFESNKILFKNFLKTKLNKLIKKNHVNKMALFSSVVPIYKLKLKMNTGISRHAILYGATNSCISSNTNISA